MKMKFLLMTIVLATVLAFAACSGREPEIGESEHSEAMENLYQAFEDVTNIIVSLTYELSEMESQDAFATRLAEFASLREHVGLTYEIITIFSESIQEEYIDEFFDFMDVVHLMFEAMLELEIALYDITYDNEVAIQQATEAFYTKLATIEQ